MHSKEFCECNNDTCIPREDGESDEYEIQEKCWKYEYRDFGVAL